MASSSEDNEASSISEELPEEENILSFESGESSSGNFEKLDLNKLQGHQSNSETNEPSFSQTDSENREGSEQLHQESSQEQEVVAEEASLLDTSQNDLLEVDQVDVSQSGASHHGELELSHVGNDTENELDSFQVRLMSDEFSMQESPVNNAAKLDEYWRKIQEFQSALSQRDAVIEQLTQRLNKTLQIRDVIQAESTAQAEILESEIRALRMQLQEASEVLVKQKAKNGSSQEVLDLQNQISALQKDSYHKDLLIANLTDQLSDASKRLEEIQDIGVKSSSVDAQLPGSSVNNDVISVCGKEEFQTLLNELLEKQLLFQNECSSMVDSEAYFRSEEFQKWQQLEAEQIRKQKSNDENISAVEPIKDFQANWSSQLDKAKLWFSCLVSYIKRLEEMCEKYQSFKDEIDLLQKSKEANTEMNQNRENIRQLDGSLSSKESSEPENEVSKDLQKTVESSSSYVQVENTSDGKASNNSGGSVEHIQLNNILIKNSNLEQELEQVKLQWESTRIHCEELIMKVANLEQEKQELVIKLESSLEKVSDLEDKTWDLTMTNEGLKASLEEHKLLVQETECKVRETEREKCSLEQQLQKLLEEEHSFRKVSETKITDLETIVNGFGMKLISAHQNVNNLKDLVTKYKDEISQYQSKLEASSIETQDLIIANESLKASLEEQKLLVQETESKVHETEREKCSLEQQLQKLQEEEHFCRKESETKIIGLESIVKGFGLKLISAHQNVSNLKDLVKKYKAEISQYQNKLETSSTETQDLIMANECLKASLEEQKLLVQETESKVQETEREKCSLEQQLQKLLEEEHSFRKESETKIGDLETIVNGFGTKLISAHQNVSNLKDLVKKYKAEISQYQSKLETSSIETQDLIVANECLKASLEEQKLLVQERESKLHESEREKSSLEQQLQKLQEEEHFCRAESETKIGDLETIVNGFGMKLVSAHQNISNLKNLVAKYKTEISEYQNKLETSVITVEELSKEKQELEMKHQSMTVQIRELENQAKVLSEDKIALQQDNEKQNLTLQETKSKLDKMETMKCCLEQQLHDMQNVLTLRSELENKVNELEAVVHDTEEKLADANEKINDLQDAVNMHKAESSQYKNENMICTEQILELKILKQELEKQLQDAVIQTTELQNQSQNLINDNEALKEECRKLQLLLQETKSQLNEVVATKCSLELQVQELQEEKVVKKLTDTLEAHLVEANMNTSSVENLVTKQEAKILSSENKSDSLSENVQLLEEEHSSIQKTVEIPKQFVDKCEQTEFMLNAFASEDEMCVSDKEHQISYSVDTLHDTGVDRTQNDDNKIMLNLNLSEESSVELNSFNEIIEDSSLASNSGVQDVSNKTNIVKSRDISAPNEESQLELGVTSSLNSLIVSKDTQSQEELMNERKKFQELLHRSYAHQREILKNISKNISLKRKHQSELSDLREWIEQQKLSGEEEISKAAFEMDDMLQYENKKLGNKMTDEGGEVSPTPRTKLFGEDALILQDDKIEFALKMELLLKINKELLEEMELVFDYVRKLDIPLEELIELLQKTDVQKVSSIIEPRIFDLQVQRKELLNEIQSQTKINADLAEIISLSTVVTETLYQEKDAILQKVREKELLEVEVNKLKSELHKQQSELIHLEEKLSNHMSLEQNLERQKWSLEDDLVDIEHKVKEQLEELTVKKLELEAEVHCKDLMIKKWELDCKEKELEHKTNEIIMKLEHEETVNSMRRMLSNENLETISKLRAVMDRQHEVAVSRLRNSLEKKYALREKKLLSEHAAETAQIKAKYHKKVQELCNEFQQYVNQMETQRKDFAKSMSSEDISDLQQKCEKELNLLAKGLDLQHGFLLQGIISNIKRLNQLELKKLEHSLEEKWAFSFCMQEKLTMAAHAAALDSMKAVMEQEKHCSLRCLYEKIDKLYKNEIYFMEKTFLEVTDILGANKQCENDHCSIENIIEMLKQHMEKCHHHHIQMLIDKWKHCFVGAYSKIKSKFENDILNLKGELMLSDHQTHNPEESQLLHFLKHQQSFSSVTEEDIRILLEAEKHLLSEAEALWKYLFEIHTQELTGMKLSIETDCRSMLESERKLCHNTFSVMEENKLLKEKIQKLTTDKDELLRLLVLKSASNTTITNVQNEEKEESSSTNNMVELSKSDELKISSVVNFEQIAECSLELPSVADDVTEKVADRNQLPIITRRTIFETEGIYSKWYEHCIQQCTDELSKIKKQLSNNNEDLEKLTQEIPDKLLIQFKEQLNESLRKMKHDLEETYRNEMDRLIKVYELEIQEFHLKVSQNLAKQVSSARLECILEVVKDFETELVALEKKHLDEIDDLKKIYEDTLLEEKIKLQSEYLNLQQFVNDLVKKHELLLQDDENIVTKDVHSKIKAITDEYIQLKHLLEGIGKEERLKQLEKGDMKCELKLHISSVTQKGREEHEALKKILFKQHAKIIDNLKAIHEQIMDKVKVSYDAEIVNVKKAVEKPSEKCKKLFEGCHMQNLRFGPMNNFEEGEERRKSDEPESHRKAHDTVFDVKLCEGAGDDSESSGSQVTKKTPKEKVADFEPSKEADDDQTKKLNGGLLVNQFVKFLEQNPSFVHELQHIVSYEDKPAIHEKLVDLIRVFEPAPHPNLSEELLERENKDQKLEVNTTDTCGVISSTTTERAVDEEQMSEAGGKSDNDNQGIPLTKSKPRDWIMGKDSYTTIDIQTWQVQAAQTNSRLLHVLSNLVKMFVSTEQDIQNYLSSLGLEKQSAAETSSHLDDDQVLAAGHKEEFGNVTQTEAPSLELCEDGLDLTPHTWDIFASAVDSLDSETEGEDVVIGASRRLRAAVERVLNLLSSALENHHTKDFNVLLRKNEDLVEELKEAVQAKEFFYMELMKSEGTIKNLEIEKQKLEACIVSLQEAKYGLEIELEKTKSQLVELKEAQELIQEEQRELAVQQQLLTCGLGDAEQIHIAGEPNPEKLLSCIEESSESEELVLENTRLSSEKRKLQQNHNRERQSLLTRLHHMEMALEEAATQKEMALEEKRREIEDLKSQMESMEKQLHSNRRFIEEQTQEREQEREEYLKEVTKLRDIIKEREKMQNSEAELKKEIESLEQQLKTKTKDYQDETQRCDYMEKELNQNIEKIQDLMDIIHELEGELNAKTKAHNELSMQLSLLKEAFSDQENDTVYLTNEIEKLRASAVSNDISEYVNHLESQLESQSQELEKARFCQSLLIEFRGQIHYLEEKIESKMRYLKASIASTPLISPCNSESASIADHQETGLLGISAEDIQTPSPTTMQWEELQHLEEKIEQLILTEENIIHRNRELEHQLKLTKHENELLQNENTFLEKQMQEHAQMTSLSLSPDSLSREMKTTNAGGDMSTEPHQEQMRTDKFGNKTHQSSLESVSLPRYVQMLIEDKSEEIQCLHEQLIKMESLLEKIQKYLSDDKAHDAASNLHNEDFLLTLPTYEADALEEVKLTLSRKNKIIEKLKRDAEEKDMELKIQQSLVTHLKEGIETKERLIQPENEIVETGKDVEEEKQLQLQARHSEIEKLHKENENDTNEQLRGISTEAIKKEMLEEKMQLYKNFHQELLNIKENIQKKQEAETQRLQEAQQIALENLKEHLVSRGSAGDTIQNCSDQLDQEWQLLLKEVRKSAEIEKEQILYMHKVELAELENKLKMKYKEEKQYLLLQQKEKLCYLEQQSIRLLQEMKENIFWLIDQELKCFRRLCKDEHDTEWHSFEKHYRDCILRIQDSMKAFIDAKESTLRHFYQTLKEKQIPVKAPSEMAVMVETNRERELYEEQLQREKVLMEKQWKEKFLKMKKELQQQIEAERDRMAKLNEEDICNRQQQLEKIFEMKEKNLTEAHKVEIDKLTSIYQAEIEKLRTLVKGNSLDLTAVSGLQDSVSDLPSAIRVRLNGVQQEGMQVLTLTEQHRSKPEKDFNPMGSITPQDIHQILKEKLELFLPLIRGNPVSKSKEALVNDLVQVIHSEWIPTLNYFLEFKDCESSAYIDLESFTQRLDTMKIKLDSIWKLVLLGLLDAVSADYALLIDNCSRHQHQLRKLENQNRIREQHMSQKEWQFKVQREQQEFEIKHARALADSLKNALNSERAQNLALITHLAEQREYYRELEASLSEACASCIHHGKIDNSKRKQWDYLSSHELDRSSSQAFSLQSPKYEHSNFSQLETTLESPKLHSKGFYEDSPSNIKMCPRCENIFYLEKAQWQWQRERLNKSLLSAQEEVLALKKLLQKRMLENPQNFTKDTEKKIHQLMWKFKRAESYRKALVYQKNYLMLVIGGFHSTEKTALALLAHMGATDFVSRGSSKTSLHELPHCVQSKSRFQFRVVVYAIVAVQRMKYMVHIWRQSRKLPAKEAATPDYLLQQHRLYERRGSSGGSSFFTPVLPSDIHVPCATSELLLTKQKPEDIEVERGNALPLMRNISNRSSTPRSLLYSSSRSSICSGSARENDNSQLHEYVARLDYVQRTLGLNSERQ